MNFIAEKLPSQQALNDIYVSAVLLLSYFTLTRANIVDVSFFPISECTLLAL